MRTFIGGMGPRDWGERSIGQLVSERLAGDAPINAAHVVVGDLSGDPIEVAERLNNEWPKFERIIIVGGVARARPAGTVTAYRWDGEAPNEQLVGSPDAADGEGAAFDSTLLAVSELADLPDEIIVVEIEPGGTGAERGDNSRRDGIGVERARTLVRRLATNARAAAALPSCSLGGHDALREGLAD